MLYLNSKAFEIFYLQKLSDDFCRLTHLVIFTHCTKQLRKSEAVIYKSRVRKTNMVNEDISLIIGDQTRKKMRVPAVWQLSQKPTFKLSGKNWFSCSKLMEKSGQKTRRTRFWYNLFQATDWKIIFSGLPQVPPYLELIELRAKPLFWNLGDSFPKILQKRQFIRLKEQLRIQHYFKICH